MNLDGLHILQMIQPLLAGCAVCGHVATCNYYDRDLRGNICQHCAGFVILAECALINSGFLQPSE
jgi:hypothetical protein